MEAKPRRHSKPNVKAVATNGDGGAVVEEARAKLLVAGGRAHGLEPKDLIHAITAATGLDGESVCNVRVLDQFAFVEVPAGDAERVVDSVDGVEVGGHRLRLEPVRG